MFLGTEGGHFSRSSFARALSLAAETAGLRKHVHPHMTRHTFASHLVAKIDRIAPGGAPLRVIDGDDQTDNGQSQRHDRGGYTGGYTDSSHRKTARSTQLRAILGRRDRIRSGIEGWAQVVENCGRIGTKLSISLTKWPCTECVGVRLGAWRRGLG